METDLFLNTLQRFLCRRGPIHQLRADQRSNFISARHEIHEALNEMEDKMKPDLLKRNCDWIEFNFNAPKASHMRGVWERQIRTIRSVLTARWSPANIHVWGRSSSKQPSTHYWQHNIICFPRSLEAKSPLHHENQDRPSTSTCLPRFWQIFKEVVATHSASKKQVLDSMEEGISSRFTRMAEGVHPQRNMQIGDVVLVKDDNTPITSSN